MLHLFLGQILTTSIQASMIQDRGVQGLKYPRTFQSIVACYMSVVVLDTDPSPFHLNKALLKRIRGEEL